MTETAKLLSELIALPSVNPAFLPANDALAGEQRVAEFLAAVAAKAGLDVELQQVLPRRSNLIARLSPQGKPRRRILLKPLPPHFGQTSELLPLSAAIDPKHGPTFCAARSCMSRPRH